MKDILKFDGENRWLSNFAPVKVTYDSVEYPSVEHAYVAAKTFDLDLRNKIKSMNVVDAKRFGRTMEIRIDWNQSKLQVMETLVRRKFNQEPYRSKLIATGDCQIIEGNYWGDRFWGVCNGAGQNHLGKLIMKIRSELL